MAMHTIELRWRGRCCRCRAELGAGEIARFDDRTHEVSCFDCGERAEAAALAAALRLRGTSDVHPPHTEAERERVRALIADARSALSHARHAS
jgi:hypothetical protein